VTSAIVSRDLRERTTIMFARGCLMTLFLGTCCQVGYAQSYGQNARRAPSVMARPVSPQPMMTQPMMPQSAMSQPMMNHAATMPTPNPGVSTGSFDYGMGSMPGDYPVGEGAGCCGDDGCGTCGTPYIPLWHRCFFWSYWKIRGLPSPWHSPTQLTPHVPYIAEPKDYYYFRPYNWFHIQEQQQDAARYGTDPRNPYDNRIVFDGLYEGLE